MGYIVDNNERHNFEYSIIYKVYCTRTIVFLNLHNIAQTYKNS